MVRISLFGRAVSNIPFTLWKVNTATRLEEAMPANNGVKPGHGDLLARGYGSCWVTSQSVALAL